MILLVGRRQPARVGHHPVGRGQRDLGLAAGNLIGGVAMQTLVLVIADRVVRGSRPLSTAAGSLIPALEGAAGHRVVGVTVMSAVLPSSASIGPRHRTSLTKTG